MTKSVISMIAFTVAFGTSVVLVGLIFGFPNTNVDPARFTPRNFYDSPCHRQKQGVIESLLRSDVRNGRARSIGLSAFSAHGESYKLSIDNYSESVREYVDKSEALDDSSLPADFKAAWRDHMTAWRAYSNFLEDASKPSGKISEDEFAVIDSGHDSEISRTWNDVLETASAYDPEIRSKIDQ